MGAIVLVSGHLQLAKGVAFDAKFLRGGGLSSRERERKKERGVLVSKEELTLLTIPIALTFRNKVIATWLLPERGTDESRRLKSGIQMPTAAKRTSSTSTRQQSVLNDCVNTTCPMPYTSFSLKQSNSVQFVTNRNIYSVTFLYYTYIIKYL